MRMRNRILSGAALTIGLLVAGLVGAAERLRIDAATVEALQAFATARVECVVLKGPTLTSWLYPEEARRSYLDSDLLIRPGQEKEAERVLQRLGFEQRWDESALPDWWREHGSDWERAADGVRIDLHRTLPGIGLEAAKAWKILTAEVESVVIAWGQSRCRVAIASWKSKTGTEVMLGSAPTSVSEESWDTR